MEYRPIRPAQASIWHRHWPTSLIGLLATAQLIVTLAVMALEVIIILLDIQRNDEGIFGNIERPSRLDSAWGRYGLAAIFFYTITWISTYCVVCCNRDSFYCAIHALVENISAFILSCLLIHYDDFQIKTVYILDHFLVFNDNNREGTIRTLLKGQLAAASVMLVSNVVFAGLFIWVCIKVFWMKQPIAPIGPSMSIVPIPMPPGPIPMPPGPIPIRPPHNDRCPTCGQTLPRY